MGRTVIDVHILQTVPPSNLSRDDTGSPKSASYGGARRARVSSQAWKRAVAERIMTIAPELRDQASAMATTVLKAANLVRDEPKKTHAESPPQRLSAAWAAREGGTR
jgi:CRISPR system Cascade subunit CasC